MEATKLRGKIIFCLLVCYHGIHLSSNPVEVGLEAAEASRKMCCLASGEGVVTEHTYFRSGVNVDKRLILI